ncbi:MAG: hypothetical protein HXS50_04710 [Theionarchaea archaeon]|nr:hypothetical protein [Theionarchaea archaeon]
MGVHRVTSDAARAYVRREKILGSAISVLGRASSQIDGLDRETLEMCGDMASDLLPHAPGYAGKLMMVIARLFWSAAGAGEKEGRNASLEDIEKRLANLEGKIG